MQEKKIVLVRYKEDRDKLITKLKYPCVVYCTGPEPHETEIPIPNIALETYGYIKYLVDNYDNLPEYTIFSQADPDPHVESFELAIDSTFTSGFGSFCYARSFYNQYASNWDRLLPLKPLLNEFGIFFDNDNNCSKNMYQVLPGVCFYLHKDRIRQRPKSFYEKILKICNDEEMVNRIVNYNYPEWFYKDVVKYHPEYPEMKYLSKKEKIEKLNFADSRVGYVIACTFEALWFTLFLSKEELKKLNKIQMITGNIFGKQQHIDHKLFKYFENDWFDWNCPNYLKWREKLIEKTIWEGEQKGFDGRKLLEFYERIGYKHISL